jgi:hypothetical protein
MIVEDMNFKINYDQLEDVLISHLYAVGILNDDEEVIGIDFGLPVDDEGNVEVDLSLVKPVKRATQLTLAFETDQ